MGAQRGVAITVTLLAWDNANAAGKTGDVANFTLKVGKDGTFATATNTATEVDATNAPGIYKLVLTAAEMSARVVKVGGKSSTASISLFGPELVTDGGNLEPHYFVTKTGNDSTGDGSLDKPWLTFNKAYTTVPDGSRTFIGPGTYAEDSGGGYLALGRVFTMQTFFVGTTARAEDVVITGASDATYNTLTSAANQNAEFRCVTFGSRATDNIAAIRISRTTGMRFISCRFVAPSSTLATRYGCQATSSGTVTLDDLYFEDCDFITNGNSNAHGCFFWAVQGSATGARPYWKNCRVDGALGTLTLQGPVTAFRVEGGEFRGTGGYGIRIGNDNQTDAGTLTGKITTALISTRFGTGHALLCGCGSSAIEVYGCDIDSANYGAVLKESSGHILRGNTIRGGAVDASLGSAVYFKGATSCVVEKNALVTDRGTEATVKHAAGATGTKSGTNTLRDNTIVAQGVRALDWVTAGETGTASVVDGNVYDLRGSATYGDVVATTGITTLAGLQAAWNSYSAGTNDDNSSTAPVTIRQLLTTEGVTVNGSYLDSAVSAVATTATSISAALTALAAKFSGITSVRDWLRLVFRKTGGDATALSEVASTFDNTTDSLEAIRDRGDAAWTSGAAATTFTLSQVAAATAAAEADAGTLTARIGASFSQQITGLGPISSRTKLYVTVKRDLDDLDADAIIQWEETAGLVRLAGGATTAGWGTLVVNSATAGDITLALNLSAAALLPAGVGYTYDVKMITATGGSVLSVAKFRILRTATRAIS